MGNHWLKVQGVAYWFLFEIKSVSTGLDLDFLIDCIVILSCLHDSLRVMFFQFKFLVVF